MASYKLNLIFRFFSTNQLNGEFLTLPGGEFGFYPQLKTTNDGSWASATLGGSAYDPGTLHIDNTSALLNNVCSIL